MPKRKGPHQERRLSAVAVRNLSRPGRYHDGHGLSLVIDGNGNKRWSQRLHVAGTGRRVELGLGSASLVSLGEAREVAFANRKMARDGIDPREERKKALRKVPTVREAVLEVHKQHSPTWKHEKYPKQWLRSLEIHALPIIGDMAVNKVETSDVLRVLSPIWTQRHKTARLVKQRLETVFDWCRAQGHREAASPLDGINQVLPRTPKRVQHFKALSYHQAPEFIAKLRNESSASEVVALALELLALTAARSAEVREATWDEIDWEAKVWEIPGARMKSGKPHRVPLAARAIEILGRARELNAGGELIFPGMRRGRPISDTTFPHLLQRLRIPTTAHGLRSSFADWASESTNFKHEIREAALAHQVPNAVVRAYTRTTYFDQRRELMEAWARYLDGSGSAEVIELKGRAG